MDNQTPGTFVNTDLDDLLNAEDLFDIEPNEVEPASEKTAAPTPIVKISPMDEKDSIAAKPSSEPAGAASEKMEDTSTKKRDGSNRGRHHRRRHQDDGRQTQAP